MLRELLERGDLLEITAVFIALSLIFASILSIVFIIVGGITFILSAGNEDKIKKAVHTIRFAIVGLIITFIAFFAVAWISRLLDIPFDLSFTTVVNLMQELLWAMR